MKIAVIGPTYPFKGGISHYTTILCKELQKKHHTVLFSFSRPYPKILFPGDNSRDKSKRIIRISNVRKTIDWANPFSWVKTALAIKRENFDLIIFQWWMWGWAIPFTIISLLNKVFSKIKILFLCHNVIEHEFSWWKNLLARITLSTGDYYIVHSKINLKELKRMIPRKKIKKTFHPSYEIFRNKKIAKISARKKLGIKGKTILFFGYVRPYKGLSFLLRALSIILNKIKINLIIAGEFWENKKEYDKLIKKLKIKKNVKIFDKYIPNEEIGIFFSAADLVVLPYVSATGTGVTKIAFGFNKPVIGTKVGDLPEVIENGRRGLVVSPQNPKELAKAIIKCYQKNLIPVFEKNIKQDKSLFSWENLVKIIESFQK